MPLAIEQFDLSDYDLVISSSHAVAKGVITGPNQLHICICYTPIRYAWDLQHQYLRESGLNKGLKGLITKLLLHKIRIWDARTSNGVDLFIAISNFISRRIWKIYRRKSLVIYPPVDVDRFVPGTVKEDYFLTASRMVPYKKIDLIAESFRLMPDKVLIIIGDGPDFEKCKNKKIPNVKMLGYQPFETLLVYMQRARAFIFAAEEDFGITLLEAQACGTPVIAFGKGGALETIKGLSDIPDKTGVFFYEQTVDAIIAAVNKFDLIESEIDSLTCRNNALRFSPENFRVKFKEFIDISYTNFLKN
jgi:glycosyltransferase involved in cell wall biosynthesis